MQIDFTDSNSIDLYQNNQVTIEDSYTYIMLPIHLLV